MSNPSTESRKRLTSGHYHCIECGSLFESEILESRDLRCPICGHPPTGRILAGTELDKGTIPVVRSRNPGISPPRELHGVNRDAQEIYEATMASRDTKRRGRVKRTKRREKRNPKVWFMLGGWFALMVVVVSLAKVLSSKEDDLAIPSVTDQERQRMKEEAEASERRMLVEASVSECGQAVSGFLNAPSPEGKAQYVYQGEKIVSVMNRYYLRNPSFSATQGDVRMVRGELLNVEGRKVIGALCRNSLGEWFEVVFIYKNQEWKIDWHSLVRYDEKAWSMFTSGEDGDEGEFRLYMRVRDSNKELDLGEMSVVFYKPKIYLKTEFSGLASKSVRVPIDSELGRRIREIQKSGDGSGKDAYGYTKEGVDPPGYHRVKVRMRLHKKPGEETRMELLEILANHWYGIDMEPDMDAPAPE